VERREAARGAVTPEAYARWRASPLGATTEALEEEVLRALAGDVRGRTVLEVGCGDGTRAAALAAAGARVVSIDRSPAMAGAARSRGAAVIRADAGALPVAAGTFDLVLCANVLAFVSRPGPAVEEMARALHPGGRLVLADLAPWSLWGLWRRARALHGDPLWRTATFRGAAALGALARRAGLEPESARGCVRYPPVAWMARAAAPLERRLVRSTLGAAFVAVSARRPLGGPGGAPPERWIPGPGIR
jgi:SAM-dependent methyltransferase